MKCSNCGAEIADDSLFCTFCGAKQEKTESVEATTETSVEETAEAVEEPVAESAATEAGEPVAEAEEAVAEETATEESEAEETATEAESEATEETATEEAATEAEESVAEETTTEATVAQPVQDAQPVQVVNGHIPTDDNAKKSNKKIMIGIGVVGAVAVIAIIIAAAKLIGGMTGKVNEKAIVYSKGGSLYYSANMDKEDSEIEFDDSKEGFGPVRLIDNGNSAVYIDLRKDELKLVNLSKLKKDSSKNSNYITEIDKNVDDFSVFAKDEIYYITDDGDFFLYNGKESVEIDDEVEGLNGKLGKKMTYYKEGKGETSDLYVFDPKKKTSDRLKKNVVIESNCLDKVYVLDDGAFISIDEKGKEKKLAEDVSSIIDFDEDSEVVYFTREETKKAKGIDFVEDDITDEEPKEPEQKDYLTETTPEVALSEYDYAAYVADPAAYLNSYNMYEDEDMGMKYTYGNDFNRVYTDGAKWYVYDDDTYWDDYYDYKSELYDYEDAVEMLEELEDIKIETVKSDLYILKGGKETLIRENVGGITAEASKELVFFYEKEEKDSGKIKLSELSYADEIEYLIDSDYEDEDADYLYQVGTSKSQKFKDTPYIVTPDYDGDEIVVATETDEDSYTSFKLVSYKVSGSELKEVEVLSKDAFYGRWRDGAYYFMSDVDLDDDTAKLNVYKDGKTEEIAKKVSCNGITVTEKDTIVSLSDNDLVVFDKKGDKNKIDKDVDSVKVVNSDRFVYVSDEDLYVYTGKEDSRRIAKNIDSEYSYWVNQNEECFEIY